MLLCLDAGNTRLKWGLHDGKNWLVQRACAYAAIDDLPRQLPALPTRLLACNVAGPQIAMQIETLAATLRVPYDWFKSSAACAGVTNGYEQPAQLGADRWAALIGARALCPGAVVVVMAGTATTVDALAADGHFLGGLILPGIDLMRGALASNTANLPAATGRHAGFPANTGDAIISGCLEATVGAIERMAARLRERTVGVDFSVLLSGGAAELLAVQLDPLPQRVDMLVLEGLARAASTTTQVEFS